MEAIVFALLSFIGWGSGDIFTTMVTRKIGMVRVLFWNYLTAFIVALLFLPFIHIPVDNITLPIAVITAGLVVLAVVGTGFFYASLKHGPPVLVGPIAFAYAPISVLLSVLFLHERLTFPQVIAILIVLGGLLLATFSFHDLQNTKIFKSRGVQFAFLTMLCWGIYYAFLKVSIVALGWFLPLLAIYIVAVPVLFIALQIKKVSVGISFHDGLLIPFLCMIGLLRLAEITYNIAVGLGQTAIVVPIASSNSVLFTILALLVFKDPITKQQIVGIFLTVIGIVTLSFFSI